MLAYNHEDYISDAIESIVRQRTKYKFDLLIGEDQSSDNTLAVVHRYQDRYPHLVRVLPSNVKYGIGENMRRLIASASSEYIAFCEGDDLWTECDRIDLQVDLLSRNDDVSFVYGDFDRIAYCQGGWRLLRQSCQRSGMQLRDGHILEDLMDRVDIHLSTVMCRAQLLKDYIDSSVFDANLWLADVPMFLYLASRGRVLSMKDSLGIYRHHPGSITQLSASSRLMVVRDHVTVVKRCEVLFDSPQDRIMRRAPVLKRMLAEAAYSDANVLVYLANAQFGIRNCLRLFLMISGALHRFWLSRARRRAWRDFYSNSEPFVF